MSLSTAKPANGLLGRGPWSRGPWGRGSWGSGPWGCAQRGRRIALLLSIAVGLAWGAAHATIAAASSESERANPTLWQVDVTSDSNPATAGLSKAARLYLLGSIHVGPRGGWQLPAATLAHFEASDALVVEVDMRDGSPESQDDVVLRYGLLPGGARSQETELALVAKPRPSRYCPAP